MNFDNQNTPRQSQAFTIIEMLVVIGIIAILSGMVVWGVTRAATARKLNRVRAELHQLETVIDAYHEKLGFYPPDNPKDCTKPPLFYELTGTTNLYFINPAKEEFATIKGDFLSHGEIHSTFEIEGFANSNPESVQNFFPELKGVQHRAITNIAASPAIKVVDVLVVPIPGPDEWQFPPQASDENDTRLNTWRYVSTHPTNNPASYDLWADVMIRGELHRIGNWKE